MARNTSPKPKRVTIELPPEFIALCKGDNVPPEVVLRGFIADLAEIMNWADNPRADGYSSNGSDERRYAMDITNGSATRGCSSPSADEPSARVAGGCAASTGTAGPLPNAVGLHAVQAEVSACTA